MCRGAGLHWVIPREGFYGDRPVSVSTATGPGEARRWLPCLDQPAATCTWAVSLDLPAAWTAACAGTLERCERQGGRKTMAFALEVPAAAAAIGFVAGDLDVVPDPALASVTYLAPRGFGPQVLHATRAVPVVRAGRAPARGGQRGGAHRPPPPLPPQAITFFQQLLGIESFSYDSYQVAFVDEPARPLSA